MVRLVDVAVGQEQADARGRDGRAVVALQVMGLHVRAARHGPGVEVAYGARRARAELEVVAHVQAGRHGAVEGLQQELLGRGGREVAGERQHHHSVDAAFRQHGDALLVRHELLEPRRMEHLVGIDVERERHASAAGFPRRRARAVQQEAMPPMHAVEHAEGARRALEERMVERLVNSIDLCHETPPFETHSASRSERASR